MNTITMRTEGAVVFAEIAAPPMNPLGPELVRDIVSLIRFAEDDDSVRVVLFRSADTDLISHVDVTRVEPDSDLFGAGVRTPDPQRLIERTMNHGLQTREAELDLAKMLGDLAERPSR